MELNYFEIDGEVGGNQDWFSNVVMHIGGCAAAAACDTCIYFAKWLGNMGWYPFEIGNLSKRDYVAFSQMMKPYIKPRVGGVRKPEWFTEGFAKYLEEHPNSQRLRLRMEIVRGEEKVETAGNVIKKQIDDGYPIPFLLLRHQNEKVFRDYIWHWFMVIGYEEAGEDLFVQTATYGEKKAFLLKELWDTGNEEKGGMVVYQLV